MLCETVKEKEFYVN